MTSTFSPDSLVSVTARPSQIEPAQQTAARLVGFLYLFQMATAVFGQSFVRDRLIVRGDAGRTAQNILGAEGFFRLSIVGDLITYTGVIVLIWALYILLRPINRNLALLALLFRLAENAILCFATVSSLVVLKLLTSQSYLKAFETGQLHALAVLALNIQGQAMNIAFVLLGLGSSISAWLLLKSSYVPKVLALWGIFSSLLLSFFTLAIFLFPTLSAAGMAYMAPMGIYEVGLGLRLLTKGIRSSPAAT